MRLILNFFICYFRLNITRNVFLFKLLKVTRSRFRSKVLSITLANSTTLSDTNYIILYYTLAEIIRTMSCSDFFFSSFALQNSHKSFHPGGCHVTGKSVNRVAAWEKVTFRTQLGVRKSLSEMICHLEPCQELLIEFFSAGVTHRVWGPLWRC